MEKDRLASLMERPSASQMDYLPPFCCPTALQLEVSQSPVRTPSPSPVAPIRVVSPPQSSASLELLMVEEDAVFHTPPEHHALSLLSSSEDQNPHDFCAEEPAAKFTAGEEFGDDTVPLGETEVVVETEEVVMGGTLDDLASNGVLVNNGVAKLDGIDGNHELGGEIGNVVDIGDDSSESFDSHKIVGDGIDKGVKITKNAEETAKNAGMQEDGRLNEGVRSSGERTNEKITKEGMRSSDERSKKKKKKKKAKDAEMQKDGGTNEGVKSSGKRSKKKKHGRRSEGARSTGKEMGKIEEFRYVSEVDGKRRKMRPWSKGKEKEAGESLEKNNGSIPSLEVKERDFGERSEKNNELQLSLKGKEDLGKCLENKSGTTPSEKEKEVGESLKNNSEWQDFMVLLKRVEPFREDEDGYNEDEDRDVDYIQTARDRGMNFVKPRIWD